MLEMSHDSFCIMHVVHGTDFGDIFVLISHFSEGIQGTAAGIRMQAERKPLT